MKIDFRIIGAEYMELLVNMRIIFIQEIQDASADDIASFKQESFRYLSDRFAENSFFTVVGFDGDLPVSCAWVLLYELPPLPGKLKRITGHIFNYYTVKEYRRRGIGSDMMKFIAEESKRRNVYSLFLNATKEGELVYRKAGFEDTDQPSLARIL